MVHILQKEAEATIKARLAALTPNNKALWGKMNVQQMLCHCADQLRLVFGEIETKPFGTWFHHSILKFLVLYVIKTPKGKAPTAPELNQVNNQGTRPGDFEQDRQILLQLLDRFIQNAAEKMHAHPAFGKLKRLEWSRLIYQHLDHHLEQFGV